MLRDQKNTCLAESNQHLSSVLSLAKLAYHLLSHSVSGAKAYYKDKVVLKRKYLQM